MKDKETEDVELDPVLVPNEEIAQFYIEGCEDFPDRIELQIREIISAVVALALAQVGKEDSYLKTISDAKDLRLFVSSCLNKIRGLVYVAVGEGQVSLNPSSIDQWTVLSSIEEDLLDKDGYYRFFLEKDSSEIFDGLVFAITEEVRTYALLSSDCSNLSEAFDHDEQELELVSEDFARVVINLNNSIRFALSNVVVAVGVKCVEADDELFGKMNDLLRPIAIRCNSRMFDRFVSFAFAAFQHEGLLPLDAELDRNKKWKESFVSVLQDLHDLYENGPSEFDRDEGFEKSVRDAMNNMLFCLKIYNEGFVDADKKVKRGKRKEVGAQAGAKKDSAGAQVVYLRPVPSDSGTDE